MIKPMIIAAATLAIAAAAPKAAPVAAQRTAPATTLNCILASNVFARRETDAKQKALAIETLYFYLGRLDARTGSNQLKADLKRTGNALKGVNAGPLMNSCVQQLQAKAQMLQSVGQELQQGK